MVEYKLTPEEEFEIYINQLLDKTDDKELDVELYGYPADALDYKVHPEPLLQRESFKSKPINENVDVKIGCVEDDEIKMDFEFISGTSNYLYEHRRHWLQISSKKIINIITELDIPTLKYIQRGEDFYVQLPLKILLDHSDFID